MEAINQFFIDYGMIGMFVCAFVAGSFLPFSSEAVMIALFATTDIDPWATVVSASVGNILGTMFNYYVGTLGDMDRISRWFHTNPEKLDKAKVWAQKYGGWMGLVTFLPFIGSVIAIAMGLMRCNVWLATATTTFSKFMRYVVIALLMGAI